MIKRYAFPIPANENQRDTARETHVVVRAEYLNRSHQPKS